VLLFFLLFCLISCQKEHPTKDQPVKSQTVNQILSQKRDSLVKNSRKPKAWGKEQTIYVFADRDVWFVAGPYLLYSIERKFFTTENEQLFDIEMADIRKIDEYYRYKNLVFLADINSILPVSQYVQKAMPEQVMQNTRERKATMYMNTNLWADDQIILFFIGDSPASIREYLYDKANDYFNILKERFLARIFFQTNRLKGYKDAFFQGMPFKMFIPETYRVYRKDLENNFISFIWRTKNNPDKSPDKYISIYWEHAETNPLNDNWIYEKRAELAWKYYDEDEFDIDGTMRGLTDFNNYEAWFLSGRWQNKKYFVGGAFQSFAFYDEGLQMVYLIDTVVYYPAGFKLKYLLELESIVQTIVPTVGN
jgi:hypothetical protein